MTAPTTSSLAGTPRSRLLRYALRGDGLVNLIGGPVVIAAASTAPILGAIEPAGFVVAGVLGLAYGGVLLYAAAQEPPTRGIAVMAVTLNVLWVIGTAANHR